MRIELMTARRQYTGEFKANLVAEYIKGEKTLAELAATHQVHPNQIKNWKSTLLRRANELLDDRRLATNPKNKS
jgi:transposase